MSHRWSWREIIPQTVPNENLRQNPIAIRQVKYLNNIVEQDHRGVKRVTRPMLGFKAFGAAQDTLVGIELMHMIRKKQMVMEAGEEGRTAAEQFYSLAA
jgi:transposase-like protein